MSGQMLITSKCPPADITLRKCQHRLLPKTTGGNPEPSWTVSVTHILVSRLRPRQCISHNDRTLAYDLDFWPRKPH